MAIQLDELQKDEFTEEILEKGLDIHVIPKRIKVEQRASHHQFRLLVRGSGIIFVAIGIAVMVGGYPYDGWLNGLWFFLLAFLPGLALWGIENSTRSYFDALQQSINQAASQVDIYIQNRVTLMKSLANSVDKGLKHELDVMLGTAQARGGGDKEISRIYISEALNKFSAVVESYPDIKSMQLIENMMQKDAQCVSDITAARVLYNDKVGVWNRDIFQWPIKQMVAADCGYTTRIPFVASASVKRENEESVF